MCTIEIEPCNQAHRHLRQAMRDAEMAIMDEIENEEEEDDADQ